MPVYPTPSPMGAYIHDMGRLACSTWSTGDRMLLHFRPPIGCCGMHATTPEEEGQKQAPTLRPSRRSQTTHLHEEERNWHNQLWTGRWWRGSCLRHDRAQPGQRGREGGDREGLV